MKNFFIMLSIVLGTSGLMAQEKPLSPPMSAEGEIDGVEININYSAPSARDREIWDGLVPYGKVWRTGANEATTISFSQPVTINGTELAAGKYALFTVPNEDEWEIIFNTEWKQWGAYKYDESNDALRIKAEPMEIEHEEQMVIAIKDNMVKIAWADRGVGFEVKHR